MFLLFFIFFHPVNCFFFSLLLFVFIWVLLSFFFSFLLSLRVLFCVAFASVLSCVCSYFLVFISACHVILSSPSISCAPFNIHTVSSFSVSPFPSFTIFVSSFFYIHFCSLFSSSISPFLRPLLIFFLPLHLLPRFFLAFSLPFLLFLPPHLLLPLLFLAFFTHFSLPSFTSALSSFLHTCSSSSSSPISLFPSFTSSLFSSVPPHPLLPFLLFLS